MTVDYLRSFHDEYLDEDGFPSVTKIINLGWKISIFQDDNFHPEYGNLNEVMASYFVSFKGNMRFLSYDSVFSSGIVNAESHLIEYREKLIPIERDFKIVLMNNYWNKLIASDGAYMFCESQESEVCFLAASPSSLNIFKSKVEEFDRFFFISDYHKDFLVKYKKVLF